MGTDPDWVPNRSLSPPSRGGFDCLLKARVRDVRAYREFTASAIWALPGVRETHTYVVMEEVKEASALPVR